MLVPFSRSEVLHVTRVVARVTLPFVWRLTVGPLRCLLTHPWTWWPPVLAAVKGACGRVHHRFFVSLLSVAWDTRASRGVAGSAVTLYSEKVTPQQ